MIEYVQKIINKQICRLYCFNSITWYKKQTTGNESNKKFLDCSGSRSNKNLVLKSLYYISISNLYRDFSQQGELNQISWRNNLLSDWAFAWVRLLIVNWLHSCLDGFITCPKSWSWNGTWSWPMRLLLYTGLLGLQCNTSYVTLLTSQINLSLKGVFMNYKIITFSWQWNHFGLLLCQKGVDHYNITTLHSW